MKIAVCVKAVPDAAADESSDESLLERAARGDEAAYARLYDRYQGMIYGLAVRITGDAALAQDVAQDALVGIWLRSVYGS